jgi:membrane associated rhomboid family serine protease
MTRPPRPRERPTTVALIAVCCLIFGLCWVAALLRADAPGPALLRSVVDLDDAELLEQAGALSAVRVWLDGQWWRVATAGLLHGSWVHLLLNMLALWVVGQWTEKAWGWWRQLVLFSVASVGGCLASLAWAEASLVVGASAGIFGVAGALVVARAWGTPELQSKLEPVSAKVLGFWLVFWLVIGALLPLFGVTLLAQAGHMGGLIFGCLVAWAFSMAPERRFSRLAVGAAACAGIVGLGFLASAPAWRVNYRVLMGLELLEREQFDAASAHFDEALLATPDDHSLANAVAYYYAEAGVELERAEDLVRGALEVEPDNAAYLDTLGWVQCRRGLVDEGLENLEVAARMVGMERKWMGRMSRMSEYLEHIGGCGTARVK